MKETLRSRRASAGHRALAAIVLCAVLSPAARAEEFDHSAWDHVLKRFVTADGRGDYAALRADRAEFASYIAAIAARSPESHPGDFPTREAQLAYWLNAYNALVIQGVVDHWPTKSVRDLGFLFGFFRRQDYVVGGRKMSLNNIEHDVIRKKFAEPRIHFALVCASLGCPRLRREAYTPAKLEEQLEQGARDFLRERRNFRIDPARNRVTLSKIFDWYGDDFVEYMRARIGRAKHISGTGNPVLDFVRLYLDEASEKALGALKSPRVDYADYSWEINAVANPSNAGSSR